MFRWRWRVIRGDRAGIWGLWVRMLALDGSRPLVRLG